MSTIEQRIDPVTAAVIGGGLTSIAVEMGYRLARMSYSSIIRESEDFGCAICDHERRQLCESTQSTPLQSGPIPGYLRGIDRRFAEVGDRWRPGDVVVHNHPYYGASHQPDVAFCVPIFLGDDLVGFSVTAAHHLDLGALTPGSCGIVDAGDAFAEGLLLNAVKVEEEGRRVESAWRIIADNTRLPQLVVGDMEAQVAAAKLGAARMLELIERYGLETVRAASEDLMDHSETMLRREIERLPDGRYEAEGFMDGFLDHPDPRYRDLRVKVALTVSGSDLHVDLAGTADQVELPINMPFEGTVDIAICLTLRAILLDTVRHDAVATNAGLFRPITISAPEGCLANPRFPAPTIARFCPGNIIADTVMRALAPVLPEAVAAGVGNLKVVAYSGAHDGASWVYMDIVEGSYGGRHGKDGLDAVDTLYANTRNNPIEDIESHYPLRVRRYELVDGGAGAGRWRGGLGSVRDIEFLADGGFSLEGDGNLVPPPGLFGGEPGTPGSVTLNPDGEAPQSLPSKIPYRKARRGDVLRLVGPCGGGYGEPSERDPAAIERDPAERPARMSASELDTEPRSLAGDLAAAARFGATGRGGTSRFAWSPELAEVTEWVAEELERLGLEPEVDAAGNLIARWPAPEGKAVMAGSHLDTVPNGGAFDGVLGVLGAVEAVRLLRRGGFEPARPIWIGAFMDEEGTRFGTALFGSRAFAGHDMSACLASADREGVTMADAMRSRGLDPARVGEAERVGELAAYLELHVEQGPVLFRSGRRLGVVESITGVLGFDVTVRGEANHAGATPIDMRRDALVGASRVVLALRTRAQERPELRATVGRIATTPGAITVIPGECRFTVDLRPSRVDVFEPARAWFVEMVEAVAAEEGLRATVRCDYALEPTLMDRAVVEAIEDAARGEDVEPLRMWSGAGHDAMVIARRAPAGMIFVPSRDGISHSPREWTDTADCELGARVLAGALRRLAS